MHNRGFFEEKTHLQRNISHIDRPHPSQSKLLPLGLQIIRSQFIDHGISRLFPLTGQNEKHRIQWTFKKNTIVNKKQKTSSVIPSKNLNFAPTWLFSENLGSWVHTKWKLGMTQLEKVNKIRDVPFRFDAVPQRPLCPPPLVLVLSSLDLEAEEMRGV